MDAEIHENHDGFYRLLSGLGCERNWNSETPLAIRGQQELAMDIILEHWNITEVRGRLRIEYIDPIKLVIFGDVSTLVAICYTQVEI